MMANGGILGVAAEVAGGSERVRNIIIGVVSVGLTALISTGVSFWFTEQAEQRLERERSVVNQTINELRTAVFSEITQLTEINRRELLSAQERLSDRFKTIDDRLIRGDVLDSNIQTAFAQAVREIMEKLEERVTVDDKEEFLKAYDRALDGFLTRLRDLEQRQRELEQNFYSNRRAQPQQYEGRGPSSNDRGEATANVDGDAR